jgi:hypothetical protein
MGRHAKPRTYRYLTGTTACAAAAPTLAGIVAAFCLTQAPPADAAAPLAAHPVVLDATGIPTALRAHASPPATYTVRPGDTLSSIAAAELGNPAAWPGIYDANTATIGGNPNSILAGEELTITAAYSTTPPPASVPVAPVQAVPAPAPTSGSTASGSGEYGHPYYCGDGDGDGYDIPCSQLHEAPAAPAPAVTQAPVQAPVAPVQAPAPAATTPQAAPPPATTSYTGTGGFQSCVISRESGGTPNVMNSSGHYGLYQFSASTWAAYGGSSGTFGNASVAEQNQVFATAMADGGESNWAPYDGC